MRNKIITRILITLLVLLGVAGIVFSGSYLYWSAKNKNVVETMDLAPIGEKVGELYIEVDPRIELLTTIQLLADYKVLTHLDSEYKKELLECFSQFKDHKAVRLYKRLATTGFSFDAPPKAVLSFSPSSLEQDKKIAGNVLRRGQFGVGIQQFVAHMRDFAIESDFEQFYNSHKDFYQEMLQETIEREKDQQLLARLLDYYGLEKDEYHLVLSPLLHGGEYGGYIQDFNDRETLYGIIGPVQLQAGMPSFSSALVDGLIWHEFSHTFVNAETVQVRNLVANYKSLYQPIRESMQKQEYTTWESSVNEHVVRAVTTRLSYLYKGHGAGDEAYRSERAEGFIYLDKLLEKLEYYERNRDQYPDFHSYYPELVDAFREYAEMNQDL